MPHEQEISLYEKIFEDQTTQELEANELQQFRSDVHYFISRIAEIRKDNPEIAGWAALLNYGEVGIYPDMESMFEDFEMRGIDGKRTPVQRIGPQKTQFTSLY